MALIAKHGAVAELPDLGSTRLSERYSGATAGAGVISSVHRTRRNQIIVGIGLALGGFWFLEGRGVVTDNALCPQASFLVERDGRLKALAALIESNLARRGLGDVIVVEHI